MAFRFRNSKGKDYYLHARKVELKGGRTQTLYFFAKEAGNGAMNEVPTGYEVAESKNGLPVLKKKA